MSVARVAAVTTRLMGPKIFGRWSDYGSMREDWFEREYDDSGNTKDRDYANFPTWNEIIFASYGGGSYEGDATVIFTREDKLFEAHGSHCSCYGLEGQWSPEETSVAALGMREKKKSDSNYHFLSEHENEAYEAYWRLVDSLQAQKEIDAGLALR